VTAPDWGDFVFGVLWAPAWACFTACLARAALKRWPPPRSMLFQWSGVAATLIAVAAATQHWAEAGGAAVSLGASGLAWLWTRRKKRRKAAALTGAKSRAVRDRLARALRESAKPRPVLRPLPGGAR